MSVVFNDGARVALEVQRQPITDAAWLARHRDYADAGIVDVWLWHQSAGPPGILYVDGQPGWTFDLNRQEVGIAYSPRHIAEVLWRPGDDLDLYIDRWPPRSADHVDLSWYPLDAFRLIADGLLPPQAFRSQLAKQVRKVRETATRLTMPEPAAKDPEEPTPTAPARLQPATVHRVELVSARPPWQPSKGSDSYFCRECGTNLTAQDVAADPRHCLAEPPTI